MIQNLGGAERKKIKNWDDTYPVIYSIPVGPLWVLYFPFYVALLSEERLYIQ